MYIVPTQHQSQRDLESILFIRTVEGNFDQWIPKSPTPSLLQTVLLTPGSSCFQGGSWSWVGLALASLTGNQVVSPVPHINHSTFHTTARSHSLSPTPCTLLRMAKNPHSVPTVHMQSLTKLFSKRGKMLLIKYNRSHGL